MRPSLNALKYRIARTIEQSPSLSAFLYNYIAYFPFLLPHEKDYYGMQRICENDVNRHFVDIGANIGLSSLGFRALGFKNKIFLFEPNPALIPLLRHAIRHQKDVVIENMALGNDTAIRPFYVPRHKKIYLHRFGTLIDPVSWLRFKNISHRS
jgi:hypothetical protein